MTAAIPSVAFCGHAPHPAELLGRWTLDPVLLAALAVALIAVLRAGPDRVSRGPALLALAALAVAFVSPLCALSSALFSARTVHHLLVVAVAAPLLALALPRSRGGALGAAFATSTAVLWGWHVPALYTAGLESMALYWTMQATLLASALWFWRQLIARGASPALALFALFAAVGQMGLVGAILTFAPRALYPHHQLAPLMWGLTPLQDQQLAGLLMWVPAMLPYALFALIVARRGWTGAPSRWR